VAGGAAAQASDAGTIVKSAGPVTATLSWQGADYGISSPSLTIVRTGVTYPVTITDICQEGCILVADPAVETSPGSSMLKVADLDADGEPEVLVDTFSGGAHCCVTSRVLTFNGSGYSPLDTDWRDAGYVLRDADGDGRPELVGSDPRFAAAFTAFAASFFPIQVLQVTHGAIFDVTRRFPALVRREIVTLRKELRAARRTQDIRGVLAAYVADQYLLGHGSKGLAELTHQRRAKRISASFRGFLLRRLHSWGYR
jgi:hypothetical protein